jgi:hypothetical protein
MIDILIPLYKSKIDYLDLRYCLRSIEKHLKNYGNIYIIGQKPKWIKNVTHIPFEDNPKKEFKERNIYNKVLRFCTYTGSSDDFLFMNDDHILLQETDAINYPFYSNGDLTERMNKNKSNYRATLNHTRKYLRALGLPETHFDVHCPIVYNKELFIKTFAPVDWNRPWGYTIKSIYASVNGKKPEPFFDCKMTTDATMQEIELKLQGRHIMSCDDGALKENLITYLNRELAEKSRYEH